MVLSFEYNTDIYNSGTIKKMAQQYREILERMTTRPTTAISEIIQEEPPEFPALLPLEEPANSEKESRYPVSGHQERLWFIDTFEKGNLYEAAPVYHNIPLILKVTGPQEPKQWEQGIREVIRRHEALRTLIVTDGDRPYQVILPEPQFNLEEIDMKAESGIVHRDDIVRIATEEFNRPFDVEKEPLVRGRYYRRDERTGFLVITLHHHIADRSTVEIVKNEILTEIDARRKGKPATLSPVNLQYRDYSHHQHNYSENLLEPLRFYWRRKLHGKLQALELPTDRPRAPIHIYNAGRIAGEAPEELNRKFKARSRQEGITPQIIHMTAFNALLHRYTGQQEIVIGNPWPNRRQPGTQDIVGPLANLHVIRTIIPKETTVRQLQDQLKQNLQEAQTYGEMPFDRLVQELKPDVDMSRTALFDVLFQYEESTETQPPVQGMEIEHIETNHGWGKYDLNHLIRVKNGFIEVELVYNRHYHDETTIRRMMGHYLELLEQVIDNPDTEIAGLTMITAEEQRQLLQEWNQTRIDYPLDKTIHRLFEEQQARTPDAAALVDIDGIKGEEKESPVTLTYRELNRRAEILAGQLRTDGVTPESNPIVAMKLNRTPEMIIGILAILKAGGAYLPIDPDTPEERSRFILEDSNARILFTGNSEILKPDDQIDDQIDDQNRQRQPGITNSDIPSSIAYIIYTSGTTGRPKGCMVTHRNVVSLMTGKHQPHQFSSRDVWTMFHQYNFDFSVWEMYGALLNGGKLIQVSKRITRDPEAYLDILEREAVTILNQTPSAFTNLSEVETLRPEKRLAVSTVIFGGEALNPVHLKPWKEKYPETRLFNMYGITETTVHVTNKEIGEAEIEAGIVNIGKPLPTLRAVVVDCNMNPQPVGIAGEILVNGEGVAMGYLNRPELTAEKFISAPHLDEPAPGRHGYYYRSGDQARRLENGDLEYRGRIDHQVKIRGFRIELGEIETRLITHPDIKDAVVIAHKDPHGTFHLAAYVVLQEHAGEAVQPDQLSRYLGTTQPEYQIPAFFVQLRRIPLTNNGKVDRKALPDPTKHQSHRPGYIQPETEQEMQIASIWRELLKVERIGVNDNFFEMGGNSLTAVQLKNRLEQTFNRKIPVVVLFERMTIRSFIQYLKEDETSPESQSKIDRTEAISRAKQGRSQQRTKRKLKK